MKTITIEQEYQLIEKLIDLEKQLHNNENKKIYCTTSIEKSKNLQVDKSIRAMLMLTINELKDIENPLASMEILDHLKALLYQLKHEISNPDIDYPISRSQNRGFNDFFVSKILIEVKTIIDAESQSLTTPIIILTSDEKDGFDKIKLRSFFEEEINIVQRLKPVNYIALQDYYKGFADRLFIITK